MPDLEYKSIAEAQEYVAANSAKVRDAVNTSLQFPQLSPSALFWISRRMVWIAVAVAVLGIGLFIGGAVGLTTSRLNPAYLPLAIIGGILFVAPAILVGGVRNLQLSKIKSQVKFDASAIYKQFFDEHFDNLAVTGVTSRQQASAITRRPGPVPGDARITKLNPGVEGTMDGFKFSTYWATWMWTRTYNTGKTTVTQTYYYYSLGGSFEGLNERFNDFEMSMRYPASEGLSFFGLGKRSTELENKAFEKRTAINSNDEIALRRVLTPRTQEMILQRINSQINYTEVHVGRGLFNSLRQDAHVCFEVNFRMDPDRAKVVASYTKDLVADIAHFTAFISHIHDYATLSRG